MLRTAILSVSLALALGASAQVVSNGGYATTAPAAVPPQIANTVTTYGIPSVPAINTPVTHVGPQAQQGQPGSESVPSTPSTPGEVEIQNPGPMTLQLSPANNAASGPVMNLGAASYEQNPFLGSGSNNNNNESLGEVAREMKQKEQTANAKTYTNADIDKLNQSTGVSNGAMSASATNSSWPANNGVITPPPQGSIAAPAQNQSTTGTVPATQEPPQVGPQSNAKPSAERPYEMAQNNPSNAGIPQQSAESNNESSANSNNASTKATLPKTASRLPLLGVLGFFSISMGLFVRYQRAKDSAK